MNKRQAKKAFKKRYGCNPKQYAIISHHLNEMSFKIQDAFIKARPYIHECCIVLKQEKAPD